MRPARAATVPVRAVAVRAAMIAADRGAALVIVIAMAAASVHILIAIAVRAVSVVSGRVARARIRAFKSGGRKMTTSAIAIRARAAMTIDAVLMIGRAVTGSVMIGPVMIARVVIGRAMIGPAATVRVVMVLVPTVRVMTGSVTIARVVIGRVTTARVATGRAMIGRRVKAVSDRVANSTGRVMATVRAMIGRGTSVRGRSFWNVASGMHHAASATTATKWSVR